MTPDLISSINTLMPPQTRDPVQRGKNWTMFSPRLGLTYDVFGDGKTILKLAYSLYQGGGLGTGYWTPSGLGGSMNFWWDDANGDGITSKDELYWRNYDSPVNAIYNVYDAGGNFVGDYEREYGLMWSGWYPFDSVALTSPTGSRARPTRSAPRSSGRSSTTSA
jgi:hypothetical protein